MPDGPDHVPSLQILGPHRGACLPLARVSAVDGDEVRVEGGVEHGSDEGKLPRMLKYKGGLVFFKNDFKKYK